MHLFWFLILVIFITIYSYVYYEFMKFLWGLYSFITFIYINLYVSIYYIFFIHFFTYFSYIFFYYIFYYIYIYIYIYISYYIYLLNVFIHLRMSQKIISLSPLREIFILADISIFILMTSSFWYFLGFFQWPIIQDFVNTSMTVEPIEHKKI